MHQTTEIIQRLDRIEKQLQGAAEPPLDLSEAASFLGFSKSHLYKLTSAEEIPHYKAGKKLFFDRAELRAWALSHRVATKEEITNKAVLAMKDKRRTGR